MKQELGRNEVVEMAARTRCAVCKTPYGRSGVQLMGRRGSAWLIAVTCARCNAEGLMVATIDDAKAANIRFEDEAAVQPKVMYDVTYEEWLAFEHRPPISRDDVLDVHLFLRDFDGDFVGLLGGERLEGAGE